MTNLFQSAEQDQEIRTVFRDCFSTKGYREVNLPALESYETYTSLQSIQSRKRLLKLIDHTGDILVLRPDVTIPLMRELASTYETLEDEIRCWYVQSVYRKTDDLTIPTERRQAGIELFSEQSVENDAEVIALSCRALIELGVKEFKIELGHAGILQEMNRILNLSESDQFRVKSLIQMKNFSEFTEFLQNYQPDEEMNQKLRQIIFTYGEADTVLKRVLANPVNEKFTAIIQHIQDVYERVVSYGYGSHVTIDLGMVNDMDYYSGIQFQGFSQAIGKPVLMGGRYDDVSKNFGAHLPAVGFACDVEAIFTAKNSNDKTS
ncbi:ATP phosphoribosyltransferase regulatory subunit [Sporosarcina aquimarina]|uniref:ATP phosphoribosyltransferase regulatory subunit n=1 Tax=Sporosarcina aquimarina TaxID=114975 RepID=A0ABU4FZX7_9BACL|nr:ATP phosphoribosyltransferase regulatory subunit [Sporosarcina aquimarina]MDW0110265.1 ATP phosphoribosyltransferase regulatory subunit [Sporosarcina aquimarina]